LTTASSFYRLKFNAVVQRVLKGLIVLEMFKELISYE